MRKMIFMVIILLTAYSSAIFANSDWKASKTDALTTAKSQNKRVLLLVGPGYDNYLRDLINRDFGDLVQKSFVLWYAQLGTGNETRPYENQTNPDDFPLLVVIDPNSPDSYLSRLPANKFAKKDNGSNSYNFFYGCKMGSWLRPLAAQGNDSTPQPSNNQPASPPQNSNGSLVWQTSKANAMATAKNQGKRVLLFGGLDTCGTCRHVRNRIFEEPAVKALLQQSYVLWYAQTDNSNNEFWTYAKGLGNDWRIPLLAVIDPNSPDNYVDRNISQAKSRQEQQAWFQQIYPWLQRVTVRNTGESSAQPPNMQPVSPPANPNRPIHSISTEPPTFTGMVAAHNSWRQRVSVPNLTWSASAAKVAQSWANQLKNTQNCKMSHNPNRGEYGENIYWSSGRSSTPKDVVNSWGSEVQDYDYATNQCNRGKVCGHYTQVIWRDTTQVGCGKASCDSMEIWVCNYSPPGNYNGEKPY
ncbi:MAG: hypothetical protein BWK79_02165 [Beggiatoa sp. IS2]|nr:MAG: hypothetical protein BWK79_02165 [Beggiatoa sp. IS2]